VESKSSWASLRAGDEVADVREKPVVLTDGLGRVREDVLISRVNLSSAGDLFRTEGGGRPGAIIAYLVFGLVPIEIRARLIPI
jgi:hypothetical protein